MNAMVGSLPALASPSHVLGRLGRQVLRASACVLAVGFVACSDSGASSDSGSSPSRAAQQGANSAPASKRKEHKTVDPATVGSLSGLVTTVGTPPTQKPLSMTSESFCVQSHLDSGGLVDTRISVTDGRLLNAFVWVKDGLDDYDFEASEDTFQFDQVGCMYTPRVAGIQKGQKVFVSNSDAVMHNVHTHPERNRPQNIAQPAGTPPRELNFRKDEVMVRIACDVHAWMSAWIGIVDHPFFAVTGPDGSYRFEGLPPGDYTLGVWHEKLGEQEVQVSLEANAEVTATDATFNF